MVGWILMKGVEGTDDDFTRRFEETKSDQNKYDKNALISQILRSGGETNLK